VFKEALLANANAVILAHNHPSGNIEPSNADKTVTETLVGAGKLLDVQIILDHVIIGSSGGYYSFRDSSSLIAA
jgi:DNA repair protein RadC